MRDYDQWDDGYYEDDYQEPEPFEGFNAATDLDKPVGAGLVVDYCPSNKNYRYYHFRNPIAGYYIAKYGERIDSGSGEIHPTLSALSNIRGISGVMLWDGYQVNITKASAYSWNQIEPEILRILEEHNAALAA